MINKLILIVASLFLLTSCSSLLSPVKVGPEHAYLLTCTAHPPTYHRSHLTLYVTPIDALPIYNSTQMAYSTQPFQVCYFAKNGWAEPPAIMLQPLLVQTLQNTHFFHAVTTTLVQYDYALNVQLLELKQNFICKKSYIAMKLRAQIINAKTNEIVATKEFHVIRLAPCPNPYGGVVAANEATAEILEQVALFTVRILER